MRSRVRCSKRFPMAGRRRRRSKIGVAGYRGSLARLQQAFPVCGEASAPEQIGPAAFRGLAGAAATGISGLWGGASSGASVSPRLRGGVGSGASGPPAVAGRRQLRSKRVPASQRDRVAVKQAGPRNGGEASAPEQAGPRKPAGPSCSEASGSPRRRGRCRLRSKRVPANATTLLQGRGRPPELARSVPEFDAQLPASTGGDPVDELPDIPVELLAGNLLQSFEQLGAAIPHDPQ